MLAIAFAKFETSLSVTISESSYRLDSISQLELIIGQANWLTPLIMGDNYLHSF